MSTAWGSRDRHYAPAARRSDPESSHQASDAITRSGQRGQQIGMAIDAVRMHPGSTSYELALATDIDRYVMARRLPDALKVGAVVKGEQRTCDVTGHLALTWWIA